MHSALDLGLAMRRMVAAGWAEFLDHELLGLFLFVLCCCVVTTLAAIACQTYQIAHICSLLWEDISI